ncbi:hypothetical protein EA756_17770 [Acinetobacter lactucae]|uniref:Uncharacterized protein n=1 Tax=Acinetobacter lactucae TaxID=1785128 RepID=A0A1V0KA02_9GAMM|nr:hypothetical protein OTEC02_06860 [Acinetobacter lactucae]RSO52584.1 hypothetical protein EA756_17770 [Acinetobacter lactucae]
MLILKFLLFGIKKRHLLTKVFHLGTAFALINTNPLAGVLYESTRNSFRHFFKRRSFISRIFCSAST